MTFFEKCCLTESILKIYSNADIPLNLLSLNSGTVAEVFPYFVAEKAKWILSSYYAPDKKVVDNISEHISNNDIYDNTENLVELLYERGMEVFYNSFLYSSNSNIQELNITSYPYDSSDTFHKIFLENLTNIDNVITLEQLYLTSSQYNVSLLKQILCRVLEIYYPDLSLKDSISDYDNSISDELLQYYLEPIFTKHFHDIKGITYKDFVSRIFSFQKAYETDAEFTSIILSCFSYNDISSITLFIKVLDTNNGFNIILNDLSSENVLAYFGKIHIIERLNHYFANHEINSDKEKYYFSLYEQIKRGLLPYFYDNEHYLLDDGTFLVSTGDGDTITFGTWNINFLFNYFLTFLTEMEKELKEGLL